VKKILLIEDNHDLRENFDEFLCLSGYDILTTNTGKKGVELVKQFSFDLIICNVFMPVMDGYEVLGELLKFPSTPKTPFLFSTTRSDKKDCDKGIELGADGYIVKPFEMKILLQTIEACMLSDRNISSI
jgi:DNA-binding response OmpR family regulator